MKASTTFQRALLSLSHPISVAAIAVVLLNDHLLRHVWPSWFTGKIGDFAWLIFAPFLLAALVGWLPIRSSNRDNLIGQGSIAAVGLIFGLTKTVPEFHALTIKILETLTSWPNVLRIDPTDLIALPALFIAVWIWRQSAARTFRLPNRGLVLLPLAILATMADSPAPDFGICDFKVVGSVITTRQFTSQDGGLTWQGSSGSYGNYCQTQPGQWQLPDPSDGRIQYRFIPGVSIERSNDGGQSWTKEIDLNGDDARTSYLEKTGQLFYSQPAGPMAAVIHQPTGNLIAAMGHEGVLVRTPAGVWRWVAVGDYHLPDLQRADNVVVLLSGELLYALALLALALGTLTRRMGAVRLRNLIAAGTLALGWAALVPIFVLAGNINVLLSILLSGLLLAGLFAITRQALIAGRSRGQVRETFRLLFVVIAWFGWIMAVVLFPPAKVNGYEAGIPVMAAITVAFFAVPMMLGQLNGLISRNRRALLPAVFISAVAAVLFVLPYVLWSQGGIPYYSTAMLYSLVLVVVTLIAGRRYLHRFIDQISSDASATAAVS